MTLSPNSIGIVGTSRKPDERRLPVHPDHLPRLPEAVRRQMVFETGYGDAFDVSYAQLAAQSGGVAPRAFSGGVPPAWVVPGVPDTVRVLVESASEAGEEERKRLLEEAEGHARSAVEADP